MGTQEFNPRESLDSQLSILIVEEHRFAVFLNPDRECEFGDVRLLRHPAASLNIEANCLAQSCGEVSIAKPSGSLNEACLWLCHSEVKARK